MIILDYPRNDTKYIYLTYSLAYLAGHVTNQLIDHIDVIGGPAIQSWPVVKGVFKSLVILESGVNSVKLKHGYYSKTVVLVYSPPSSLYYIQPLYVICKNSDGIFQSPAGKDNSIRSAVRRIGLGCALLQTFTAVNMEDYNLGAATFTFPIDETFNLPQCNIFHSSYTAEEMYSMSTHELWRNLAKEIAKAYDHNFNHVKYLAFISCTSYDGTNYNDRWRHSDVIRATKGYIAVGGGGLAVLGTATLHTWADSLSCLVSHLTDDTLIDRTQLLDDSAYRRTHWANYATGLGSVLHELGHVFDLTHSQSGIMARGFDNIHRFFIVDECRSVTPSASRPQPEYVKLIAQLEEMYSRAATHSAAAAGAEGVMTLTDQILPIISAKDLTTQPTHAGGGNSTSAASPLTPLQGDCKLDDSAYSVTPTELAYPDATPTAPAKGECSWAFESAVMLRYSRWLLPAAETSPDLPKPHGDSCSVTAAAGIRTVQVYYQCKDRVIHSQHFLSDSPPVTARPSDVCERATCDHLADCDGTCTCVHIRDSAGNFFKIAMFENSWQKLRH